jgi:hypothetical protein
MYYQYYDFLNFMRSSHLGKEEKDGKIGKKNDRVNCGGVCGCISLLG